MKKNYLFLIATLMLNALMFAQTVTLTPTAVNNTNVNSGPINLASVPTSTVSLNVKVDIPSNVAVSDYGTLKIYYSNSSVLNANIASGGDSGTLFFGGGRIATRSIVINLFWSDFLTSGGFIFAEYKNPAGTAYRSSNLAVIKNSTMNSGTTLNPPADAPNPTKITNTLCCNQTVRLGDKPQPITGSKFLNPYEKEPYGIKASWETNGNPLPPNILNVDNINHSLTLDHTTSLGSFTVKRKLGYIYRNEYPNTSNTVTITVVPSPILTNSIFPTDGSIPNTEGFYELSNLKSLNINGFVSKINLNILSDPNHTNQRGDDIKDVDSYRWEYKDIKYNSNPWVTIPNANTEAIDFSDPSQLSNFEDTYYSVRRIAIYKNISRTSNEVKIAVRSLRFNNTICCDQILKIQSLTNFEKPQIFTGSTSTVEDTDNIDRDFIVTSISYQWQIQTKSRNLTTWSDITGATSKDYFPNQPLNVINNNNRGATYTFESSYNYRRIAKINYKFYSNTKWINATISSYSNEVSLQGTSAEPYIKVFPNPASSFLNIESTANISNSKVTISNVLGNIVNSNNYSVITPNLIGIDITNLTTGTYFIIIENQILGITQKTFIKQ
ncbi:T9SS type A sorting domain-containing protein [Flavobacterium chungangensis]|uniref:T9SS type A sorting domain-containing protein n=1 Tax=Flavobacterium chungangensis TaxID=2708132 RepID=A0ABV8ZIU4_9FLAO